MMEESVEEGVTADAGVLGLFVERQRARTNHSGQKWSAMEKTWLPPKKREGTGGRSTNKCNDWARRRKDAEDVRDAPEIEKIHDERVRRRAQFGAWQRTHGSRDRSQRSYTTLSERIAGLFASYRDQSKEITTLKSLAPLEREEGRAN